MDLAGLKPKYIGEILLDKGLVSLEQLNYALSKQRENGKFLGEILIELGVLSDEDFKRILAEQMDLPFVLPSTEEIPQDVLASLTPQQAEKYQAIPVKKSASSITVACTNPLKITLLDQLRRELGVDVELALTTEEQISAALEKYYHDKLHNVSALLKEIKDDDLKSLNIEIDETNDSGLEALANEAPIVRMVNLILTEGVRLGASDIHFEPFAKEVKLRYRIDGILYERPAPPLNLYAAVISRLKLMAGMDITQRRLPQDGRIRFSLGERELDLRLAVVPTLHGEAAVARILNRQSLLLDLSDLGMEETKQQFTRLINLPHGMILVTGPTGSGKTTTLYAVLSSLNKAERKIITIEDPVEYELAGVTQIPVNHGLVFGFAQGIRTIVRHDPDIILVGEIRDRETAEVAIQAALTGHLVFSTLHTNDAAGAYTRLLDMGIEEYLVASTVRGVLAQRLVRKACPYCLEEHLPTIMEKDYLSRAEMSPSLLYHGVGCDKCNNLGYKGQIGLFELLVNSEKIEKLVMERANASRLRNQAIRDGMQTLRENGLKKVQAGVTTLSEVLRVTQD